VVGVGAGRIVLTGRDDDGTIARWSIDNIQTDSFLYRFEGTNDEGKRIVLQAH
jgi:hypothetical protein